MAGLDTRGAFDGFVQGFGLVNNYLNQQKQNERADQQMGLQMRAAERADQQMGLQMRNQEMREQEFAGQQQDRQLQQDERFIRQFNAHLYEALDADDQERIRDLYADPQANEVFGRNRLADMRHLFNPKTVEAVDYAKKLANGEGRLFSDTSATYINQMFLPEVDRIPGRRTRIAGVYPGMQEGTLTFDLGVKLIDENGLEQPEYFAGMTKGRKTAAEGDNEIMQVSMDDMIKRVQGAQQVYAEFGPERIKRAQAIMRSLGYLPQEKERWETFEQPDGTRIKRNTATGDEVLVQGRRPVGEKGWIDPKAKLSFEIFGSQIKEIDKQLENPMALDEKTVASLQEERRALIARRNALGAEIGLPGFSQGQQQGGRGEPVGPVKVTSKAEFEALPPGTVFISPDGQKRIKPAGSDQPTRSKPAQQPPQEQPRQPAQPQGRPSMGEQLAVAQEKDLARQAWYEVAKRFPNTPVTAGLQMPEQPRRPWDNAGLTLPPGFPR